MSLLATNNLDVSIGGKQVCRGLNMQLNRGECWAMLGANGVGKTTLLHTLAGLRPADGGQITVDGTALQQLTRRRLARLRGVLFQDNGDPFPASVLETALIGRHPHLRAWQWEGERDLESAREALRETDLLALAARQKSTLSGGEDRRLALATLLTQDPSLYLLDEPTNHLDLKYQIRLLELLSRRASQGDCGLLMILHEVNLAARFCDRLLFVYGKGEVESGPKETMLDPHRLSRVYGHPIVKIDTDGTSAFLPG